MTSRLADRWNRFWFSPQLPLTLSLYRILFGLTVLADAALRAPDLVYFMSARGIHPLATYHRLVAGPELNALALLPPGDEWLWAFFAIYVAAAVALTLGLWTRAAAVLVWWGLFSLQNRNGTIINGGDDLLRQTAFLLVLSPAGAAFSLDGRRGGGVPAATAPWAWRMMQVQVSIAYLSAFWSKVQGTAWTQGTAVYYTSRLWEFWRFPVPYVFEHLWTLRLLAWGTMAMEFSLAVLIWIPRLRYPVLAAGLLFHLGLDYAMNLPLMQWVFMGALMLFIEPGDLRRILRRSKECTP